MAVCSTKDQLNAIVILKSFVLWQMKVASHEIASDNITAGLEAYPAEHLNK